MHVTIYTYNDVKSKHFMIIHTGYSFSRMSIIMSLSFSSRDFATERHLHYTVFCNYSCGIGIFSPEFKEKDRI